VIRSITVIKSLLAKDLRLELRTKQLLPTMLALGILLAWIFRIARPAAPDSTAAVPALLAAVLFAAVLACEKSFSAEQPNDCLSALLAAPLEPGQLYIAKLLVNFIWLVLFEAVMVPLILLIFQLDSVRLLPLFGVLLLCDLGFAGVGTILAAMVQGASTASALLSVLVLSTLSPVLLPATSALLVIFSGDSSQILALGPLSIVGNLPAAAGFIAAYDVILITLSWLVFGTLIQL